MPEISPSRYLVTAGWGDVPHLSEQAQAELLASTPPHLREARSQGTPSLGSGAIYPVALSEVEVDPFALPEYWPRAYALDVGWRRTAALWAAWDPSDGVMYCYSEHYRGEAQPSEHAMAIRARGEWMPGLIDPAARGRGQADGAQLYALYRDLGLRLTPADTRDVEAGLYDVWMDLSIGRIKFFKTLVNLKAEYRIYRRDDKGRIVKEHDHALDCLRMLRRNGREIAKVRPGNAPGARQSSGVADRLGGY